MNTRFFYLILSRCLFTHLFHDTRFPLAERGVTSQLVVNKFHLYLYSPTCFLPRLRPDDASGNHAVSSGGHTHLLAGDCGFHLSLPFHPSPVIPEGTNRVVIVSWVRVVVGGTAQRSALPVRVEPRSVTQHNSGVQPHRVTLDRSLKGRHTRPRTSRTPRSISAQHPDGVSFSQPYGSPGALANHR